MANGEVEVGDIYFADFPFEEDVSQSKGRPVLVFNISSERISCLTMKITSTKRGRKSFEIVKWASAGLKRPCFVEFERQYSYTETELLSCRFIGQLDTSDFYALLEALATAFS